MNNHELIWARDRFEDKSQIEPKDCRQYLPPIDETTADQLFYNPHTTKIMEALEWRTLSQSELHEQFPDSDDLIDTMIGSGIIRSNSDGLTLAEAYYDRPHMDDGDGMYWFLTSEKQEWGLSLKELIHFFSEYLIALKFRSITDDDPVRDEILEKRYADNTAPLKKAADQLFATIASLLTDVDPGEVFNAWTREANEFR